MDDMKQSLSDELTNVVKTEIIDSETTENSFIGQNYELHSSEKTQNSEGSFHSRSTMDEMKQNLPYDLRNVIKVEKMECSSDSEMQESSYTDTSSELFSGEETQNKMEVLKQEMNLNQDMFAGNTLNKDVHAGNFEDNEPIHSNENIIHQLVYVETQPDKYEVYTKTFSTTSMVKNDETSHCGKKPFQCQMCRKKFTELSSLKAHEEIHYGKRKETTTQRKRRLEKQKRKRQEKLAMETEEQKQLRLEKRKEKRLQKLAKETEEEKYLRLEKEKLKRQEKRAMKREEEQRLQLETKKTKPSRKTSLGTRREEMVTLRERKTKATSKTSNANRREETFRSKEKKQKQLDIKTEEVKPLRLDRSEERLKNET
ncbi:zinc finger protein 468-like isoform X3 [Biomphalaria glabrata]|nr:zinc finger protein 468-like isoform X3 [Biomphalaria glabrata]